MTEQMKQSTMESDYIKDAETHYKEWQDDFNRLEDKVTGAESELENDYTEHIAILKRYLQDFEQQINLLKSADPDQWENQRLNVEESARKYHEAYSETMKIMKKTERESAGWLEGFTDHPPSGSAGWLEGFHTHAQGSEGWVEGMAHRTPKSKGWTEGYGDED
jgi:hypothetical protein